MSVLQFAEEFTRLVMRYIKVVPKNDQPTISITPLTYKEITYTVHHVLYALGLRLKESDDNNDSQIKTLDNNNELITSIHSAPIEFKINCKQDDKNACSSQDAQPTVMDFGSSISDTSQKANENEAEISPNIQNENKFISRSNPMICVSRSDTFVCEDNQKAKTDDLEDVFEYGSTNTAADDLCGKIVEPLGEIWVSAMSIVTKLNNLKVSFPQLNKQIRQLSLKLSSHTPSKDTVKTRNPKIRRSSTALTKTSTSSASLAVKIEDRRKSTGGIACNENTEKSNESKKIIRAASNLNLSVSNKMPSYSPKITKNPKYAHVRSTIPKPISQNKKKEQ